MKNRIGMRAAALASFCLAMLAGQTHAQLGSKPNVVFILADNVGYGDLGPYGGGNCAELQLLASSNSPQRACG